MIHRAPPLNIPNPSRGVTLGKQAAFKTNPINLEELLRHCGSGTIQLPDFQRSWVWDEERIKGLVASISQAFPVGALMTLEVKPGAADTFARRSIQGAEAVAAGAAPDQLLLDGQQRMTSLYQTCLRREVVQTVTPRLKLVKRWFYIDMNTLLPLAHGTCSRKAMAPGQIRLTPAPPTPSTIARMPSFRCPRIGGSSLTSKPPIALFRDGRPGRSRPGRKAHICCLSTPAQRTSAPNCQNLNSEAARAASTPPDPRAPQPTHTRLTTCRVNLAFRSVL